MTDRINYVELIKEQFNLEPTTYFVTPYGTRLNEVQCKNFIHDVNKTEVSIKKSPTNHIFSPKGMAPLITTVLFCTPKKECEIKAISIRSKMDLFDPIRGILEASRYALRHLKGRGVIQVRTPSSIRTLIDCCVNMTVHTVKNPELDLFELSLLQSKKSLVRDVQEGKITKNCYNFNILNEKLATRERENIISRLLDKTLRNSHNPFSDSKGE